MVGQRTGLGPLGGPGGEQVLVDQVRGDLALLLNHRGLKVAARIGGNICTLVDAQLADLDPAVGIGLGEADAQVAPAQVEALGLGEHVAGNLAGMREPCCVLGCRLRAGIVDLAIAVDVENELPVLICGIGSIGHLDDRVANEVEARLRHEILERVDGARLAHVDHNGAALGGSARGLGRRGHIAVEHRGGVERLVAGQVALDQGRGEREQVGALEALEGRGRAVGIRAEAHIAGALHVGLLNGDPLKAILGIHGLDALEHLLVEIGQLDVATHGAEVDRDDVALLGQSHRSVGRLEGAFSHARREVNVREVEGGVEAVLGVGELLERLQLEELEPVARPLRCDDLDAGRLDAVERHRLVRSAAKCGDLGPGAVLLGIFVGRVVHLGGREVVRAALQHANRIDELALAKVQHHPVVGGRGAAAPELRLFIAVDGVCDGVVLVLGHVG